MFGENSMFRYSPRHRWYYYPDSRNDETLVWCGYDSDPTYPRSKPHAAFKDPSVNDPPPSDQRPWRGYAFFE